ncbi:MAG: DUF308 domain-containing protein [Clostridia bacterium]|nr:DUF308 domain-containing protein [Clostridia bacterium]
MAKSKKKSKGLQLNTLLTAGLYAVIGILLIILKGGSLDILMTIVGALFIIMGIVDIFKGGDLLEGVIKIGIGIAIIIFGWALTDLVLLIFGILLIIKGVLDLLGLRGKGLKAMLPAIVMIVIGIMLVISKWALLDIICIIAGIVFIVNAVLILIGKK